MTTNTQPPASELALIGERVNALADGSTTLADIYAALETLWSRAEANNDADTFNAGLALWENAQHLAALSTHSQQTAIAAIALADEVATQRDHATAAYDKLHKAVLNVDTDHPLIEELHGVIEESIYEFIEATGEMVDGDSALGEAHGNAVVELRQALGLNPTTAGNFAAWVLYYRPTTITDDQKATLKNAIEAIFAGDEDDDDETK